MREEQPKRIVLFLDRTHGNLIREQLGNFGFDVKACNRIFRPNTPDVEWIAECARHNWVILSGNKAIEEVPSERQAVIEGKCKVFMLEDTNSRTEEWLAAILVGRQRIVHLVENAEGPFFITIRKFGHSHFSTPRFVPGTGAGWKPNMESVNTSGAPIKVKKLTKSQRRKQQSSFWEDEAISG